MKFQFFAASKLLLRPALLVIAVAGVHSVALAEPRAVISESRYIGDGVLKVKVVSNGAQNDWNTSLSEVKYDGKAFKIVSIRGTYFNLKIYLENGMIISATQSSGPGGIDGNSAASFTSMTLVRPDPSGIPVEQALLRSTSPRKMNSKCIVKASDSLSKVVLGMDQPNGDVVRKEIDVGEVVEIKSSKDDWHSVSDGNAWGAHTYKYVSGRLTQNPWIWVRSAQLECGF